MRMTSRSLHAAIFDMDGLMFDTERLSSRCWHQIGRELGLNITEELLSQARGLTGPEYRSFFERSLGESLDYDTANARKRALYWSYIAEEGLQLKPGLIALLNFLKNEGICIGMATATRQGIADRYLDLTGVRPYFDFFVFGDQVASGKPNPEIFLLAAKQVGAAPEICMVLEDSINGVKAGISGGFHTIMIPDLTQPTPEIAARLSAKCESLEQIISYLEAHRDAVTQKFYL